MLLTVWVGVLFIVAACWLLNWPAILRQWSLTDVRPWLLDQWERIGVVGVALSLLAAFYLMLAIHELGHVAAGVCVGFRVHSYRVGPLLISRPFRLSLHRGPGAIVNGAVELFPAVSDGLVWRGVAMVLGGPVANFLSATLVLLLPPPISACSVFFIAFSITNGVNDLFPFESRLGVSDGRRIWMLMRQRERGERWLALLHLGGQLIDGALPESLSTDFLAKAIAVRDASVDTVKAHAIGFWAAFHQHQDSEAGQRLETCLAYSAHAAPVLREALMSEAAVYQARRRKRADVADQWLAGIPATTPHAWYRTRAEAAILEAKGDIDGALKKLAETETAIRALPKNPLRETAVLLLQRWRSELQDREGLSPDGGHSAGERSWPRGRTSAIRPDV